MRAASYDDILTLAKRLVNEGSHMLDLCCAIVGEDEKGYMSAVLEKVATRVPAPILVDSHRGRRDRGGAEAHSRQGDHQLHQPGRWRKAHRQVLPMAKRYGAAVIALTIDEEGMALTADKKVAIAKRIYKLATEKYGMRPAGVDLRRAHPAHFDRPGGIPHAPAWRRWRRCERIKQELPEVKTILGVSNISFGLNAYPRRVLNSVFMHEAVEHGLDMAIVNYSKIYPLYKIPEAEVELARKLIFQDRSAGDPLQLYMAHFAGMQGDRARSPPAAQVESLSIEDKLKFCIIQGEKAIGEGAQQADAGAVAGRRRWPATRRWS